MKKLEKQQVFWLYFKKILYVVDSNQAENIALKNDIDLIIFNIKDINLIEEIEKKK